MTQVTPGQVSRTGRQVASHARYDRRPRWNSSPRPLELLHDLARVLVVAHPLEGGLAERALVRPLGPGDLADELRLAPDRGLRLGAGWLPDVKGALRHLALTELLRE